VVGNNLSAGQQATEASDDVPVIRRAEPCSCRAPCRPISRQRNRLLTYQRDTSAFPSIACAGTGSDLPFGRGKWLGRNAGGLLDRLIGGWQIAGMGSLRSNYFALPTGIYPTGEKIEIYGYKYPIQDCTSGVCYPGYLWWNGYIPANRINSYDAQGRPNGIMGVPENYRPAGQPLIPGRSRRIATTRCTPITGATPSG
jgi:hypothetical protein